MPANAGIRWHVSPRQRLTILAGPRIDAIGDGEGAGRPLLGELYAEATYQIDVPLCRGTCSGVSRTSRLNLGYVHSNLDGQAFDTGAVIGFFGPVDVSWDLRLRPPGAPAAVQLTVGATVARGGGPYVELGSMLGRVR